MKRRYWLLTGLAWLTLGLANPGIGGWVGAAAIGVAGLRYWIRFLRRSHKALTARRSA